MRTSLAAIALAALLAGCNAILGLDAGEPSEAASASSGAGPGSSSTGASTSSSGGAASSGGGNPSAGGGGAASTGGSGAGGSGGSACTECGVGETCNELTAICECGRDMAAVVGEQACPDGGPYPTCVDDARGVRCGCDALSCDGGFVCDLDKRECFCTPGGCVQGGCWPPGDGQASGKCFIDEATCSGYGEVVVAGLCTCNDPAASCKD